jgi:hypothetical protein
VPWNWNVGTAAPTPRVDTARPAARNGQG